MGAAKKDLMRQRELGSTSCPDKYVCADCLGDTALAAVAEHSLESKTCSYCGATTDQPSAAPLATVTDYMAECINMEYADPGEVLPYETAEGGYIGTVLNAWDLLEKIGFAPESSDLFDDVASAFASQNWCDRDCFVLSSEDRRKIGWDRFKQSVKYERRFTFWSIQEDGEDERHPDHLPVGGMLADIREAIEHVGLVRSLHRGFRLWRVRAHKTGITPLHDHELSPPSISEAIQSNRMSPAGIVMFYGAADFETACLETFDGKRDEGCAITGGVFETVREMSILDLADFPPLPSFFNADKSNIRHNLLFLYHFRNDLVQPISRDGSEHVEYSPTQAFTEYVRFEMRSNGGKPIDGIRYLSSKNRKGCYVLFCGQDNCVASPRDKQVDQWLKFDSSSRRSAEIKDLPFLDPKSG